MLKRILPPMTLIVYVLIFSLAIISLVIKIWATGNCGPVEFSLVMGVACLPTVGGDCHEIVV